jgi:diguanylate cyclase (GGDEF)-like protein
MPERTLLADRSWIDPSQLDAIETEINGPKRKLRFANPVLEARYTDECRAQARPHNRIMVCMVALVFDLYLLTELRAAPEIVGFSAMLRLLVLTPAVFAFVLLDRRGHLRGWSSWIATGLAIVPTVIASAELLRTTSLTALPNWHAIPLILLAILCWRLSLWQVGIVAAVSCAIFGAAVVMAPHVPSAEVPSLLLTDIAIGIGLVAFTLRIDIRDRQVFLLVVQAAIRRDLLAEQNRMLARLTHTDALTGLGNRRRFDDALAIAWAEAASSQAPVSLIMFDIDHFKQFNDAFGHRQGDACLRDVAAAVAGCLRGVEDTLCRYGGEEFALIVSGADVAVAQGIAERMRAAVAARAVPHPCVGVPGYVTISLGVASMVPGGGNGPAALVEAADTCLYAAKRRGRNRVETDMLVMGGEAS